MNPVILALPPVSFYVVCGAIATTLIPAIEAALRAIYAVGELFLKIAQYAYTRLTFQPAQHFTAVPAYQNVGQEFIQTLDDSIQDSRLPQSCNRQPNQATINLRFGDETYPVDAESFRSHSKLCQSVIIDLNMDLDDQEIVVPDNFSVGSIKLLKSYLQDKSVFDDWKYENLSKEEFQEFYQLAGYLQLTDLETRCSRIVIQKIIDSGSLSFDEYRESFNFDMHQEALTGLLTDIKQFKEVYTKLHLNQRLDSIKSDAWIATCDVVVNIFLAMALTLFTQLPVAGPGIAYMIFSDGPGSIYPLTTMNWIAAGPKAITQHAPPIVCAISYIACFIIFKK